MLKCVQFNFASLVIYENHTAIFYPYLITLHVIITVSYLLTWQKSAYSPYRCGYFENGSVGRIYTQQTHVQTLDIGWILVTTSRDQIRRIDVGIQMSIQR